MTRPAPAVPSPPAAGFERRCAELRSGFVRLWLDTDDVPPRLGPRVSRRRRRAAARAVARSIDELGGELERYPESAAARRRWRGALRRRLERLGEEHFGWPDGYRRLLLGDGFYRTTLEFVRAARRFDAALGAEEIGQAVRNVWIMNSLQMLLGLEIGMSPAVFAYSLLYPYTDNYLDDPSVPASAKRALGRRLGRRLAGHAVVPASERERRIFELVGRIERQFPRSRHPRVHRALAAIHGGQVRSLELQGAGAAPPADLLETQVEKGGASVLADGYLVAGDLRPDEEEFCFGYGVFLQLLDDLQDARADREAGHATLFSLAAGHEPLDRLTGRLHRYMRRIVDGSPRFAAEAYAAQRDLIVRSCTMLLVGAVAEDPGLFSRRFRRTLVRRWPLGLGAMRRLRRRAVATWESCRPRLEERAGGEGLWALIEEEPVAPDAPLGTAAAKPLPRATG